jgi:hypothetical protein
MAAILQRLHLIFIFLLMGGLLSVPGQAHAQWPPFRFQLSPSYREGRITYGLRLSRDAAWPMTDVIIKIPVPQGTRFVEAGGLPMTRIDYDGAEVTFFTAYVARPIQDTFFIVEVTDPRLTVFTTHAWISWQGEQPGDYLTQDVKLDITRQSLNWQKPRFRLELGATAALTGDVISYAITPRRLEGRMWDLTVNVPIPEGTTFLSAQAPVPFVTSFNGQEVSFSAVELVQERPNFPLTVKVSTSKVTPPQVVTHAWASWKNVGRSAGVGTASIGEMRTGDIVVQPGNSQWVVADVIGDVPLDNYDVTSLAFQEDAPGLKIIYYTVGALEPPGEPLVFGLFIDVDCNAGTGTEYLVQYGHQQGQASVRFWDEQRNNWGNSQRIESGSYPDKKAIAVWLPYDLLRGHRQLCWLGQARNASAAFGSSLPVDWIPNDDQRRVIYTVQASPVVARSATAGNASAP